MNKKLNILIIFIGLACIAAAIILSIKLDTPNIATITPSSQIEDTEETLNNDIIIPLDALTKLPFPKSYSRIETSVETNEVISEDIYNYTDETTCLIPELKLVTELTLKSSAIEDGMVYTLTHAIYKDNIEGDILFINVPHTNTWVACSVENENSTVLYSFEY